MIENSQLKFEYKDRQTRSFVVTVCLSQRTWADPRESEFEITIKSEYNIKLPFGPVLTQTVIELTTTGKLCYTFWD